MQITPLPSSRRCDDALSELSMQLWPCRCCWPPALMMPSCKSLRDWTASMCGLTWILSAMYQQQLWKPLQVRCGASCLLLAGGPQALIVYVVPHNVNTPASAWQLMYRDLLNRMH